MQRMQLERQTEMIRFLWGQQQQHPDQEDRTKNNNK
jgi:hypothetical protein